MSLFEILMRTPLVLGGLVLLRVWARTSEVPGGYAIFRRLPLLARPVVIAALIVGWLQLLGAAVLPVFPAVWLWRLFGFPLFAVGVALAIWGKLTLKANWAPGDSRSLIAGGAFGFCRHPIYFGGFLAAVGAEIALGSALMLLAIPGFFVLRAAVMSEERMLVDVFGDDYRRYMRTVPRFGI
jgi:protein-S-isoprenylcysteine O-methyltransferase Ste14